MKYKPSCSAAIFFMTIFYGPEGHGHLAPPGSATGIKYFFDRTQNIVMIFILRLKLKKIRF